MNAIVSEEEEKIAISLNVETVVTDEIVDVWIVDQCGGAFAGPQSGGIRIYEVDIETVERFQNDLTALWDYIKEKDYDYRKEIIIEHPDLIIGV